MTSDEGRGAGGGGRVEAFPRPPPLAPGFLNICKERGFTSHDVVAVVRRTLGTRRVGHAGTLDPAAEGVLPICVGRATRLVDRLADADKGYYAEVRLGVSTRTDDAEGEVVETRPIPPVDENALDLALEPFRGPIVQRPPAFSAIKVAGRRAYDLARRGDEVRLRPREVTIHRLTLLRWRPPDLAVTIACSKGTYIRSIARDLGVALGCGAHLSRLVRLWVGSFRLSEAVSLDELAAAVRHGDSGRYFNRPDAVLHHLPAIIVEPRRQADMAHGRAWPMAERKPLPQPPPRDGEGAMAPSPSRGGGPGEGFVPDGAEVRVYDTDGTFLGLVVADRQRGAWQPRLAFAEQA